MRQIRQRHCTRAKAWVQKEINMEEKCCCTRTTDRTDEDKKALDARINRIVGQLNGIKNMIADNRYCGDILIQLSAIDKSVKSLASVILNSHVHTCMVRDIQSGKLEVVDEIVDLFKRFQ